MNEKIDFFRFKMNNGMTVLFENRKFPLINVLLSFKYGSAYELEKEKGIAHVLEHSLFKGTNKRTQKEISEEIEKRGGILNAFTSEDITAFWAKISSKYFFLASDVLFDLSFNPKLDESELTKEKEVILQELRMYHDNPYLHTLNTIKGLLYNKPFGMNQVGSEKTIRQMNRNKVMNTFNKNYLANNSILCIVGKSNEEDIKSIIQKQGIKHDSKCFTKLPKIAKKTGSFIEKRKGIDQTHMIMGWHVNYNQRYQLELINAILTEGMSSRLFQEVREKRGLAYALKGMLDISKNYGHYLIYAGIEQKKIKDVKSIILSEISKLKNLEQRDLEEAKEKLIGLRRLAKEDSSNVALGLIQEELFGNAIEFYQYEDRINSIKLNQIKEAAKLGKYSFAALVPK